MTGRSEVRAAAGGRADSKTLPSSSSARSAEGLRAEDAKGQALGLPVLVDHLSRPWRLSSLIPKLIRIPSDPLGLLTSGYGHASEIGGPSAHLALQFISQLLILLEVRLRVFAPHT